MFGRGLMSFCDSNECRRSRSSVQVFIGASDREIDSVEIELDFDDADRMTEVPYHERSGFMKLSRDRGHVEKLAGPIVDVGQHGDRDVPIKQRGDGWSVRADQSPFHP